MILLLKRSHAILYKFWVAFFFFLFYPLFYLFSRRERDFVLLNLLRRIWGSFSFYFSGIFFVVKYEEKFDSKQTYIFTPNHASHLDIPLMCILANKKYHFMGKAELLKHPVMGIFFRTIDIPVNRASKIASFRAFKKASENLKKGHPLILFPEGKIADNAPVLGSFKDGAFRLAIENKIPIVPVTFLNNFEIMLDDGREFGSRPGICEVYFHRPILTENLKPEDADVLRDKVYTIIKNKFLEHNPNWIPKFSV